jgi:glutamate dehydrogenase (NAD(P)+)
MSDPFDFADALGPREIVHVHRPAIGLRAIVVVDNVACGPAIGGIRMAPDVGLGECVRLARAMTFKNAAAGLAHGGAKAVLVADPRLPAAEKERLIRALACAIADLRSYIPGPDMGTDERCMAWIKDEIGRAAGLPAALGGIPLDEIGATGWGLVAAIEVAAERTKLLLDGARIAVQGFGAVGRHAARFLAARGARLCAASDSAGTIVDPDGLDVEALIALKAQGRPLHDLPGARRLDAGAIVDASCDVWIPAARPDVVHAGNVARLDARIVVQGANIPFTDEAELALHRRGVLVVPDFIANAGGVICAAVEVAGGTQAAALAQVEERIRANTRAVLDAAAAAGITPRAAAVARARRIVHEATALRRFG